MVERRDWNRRQRWNIEINGMYEMDVDDLYNAIFLLPNNNDIRINDLMEINITDKVNDRHIRIQRNHSMEWHRAVNVHCTNQFTFNQTWIFEHFQI